MSQGWIASTRPLTAEEFVDGERVRRYHYCAEVVLPRPYYQSICGQITIGGRRLPRVLPGKPSQSRLCERCERLYEERIRAA